MRPVLFHLYGRAVHSYGVAIALAFLVAIVLGVRQARRAGVNHEAVRELCFWLLLSSMLGARLLFVATNLPEYARACSDAVASGSFGTIASGCTRALHVWEGGLVFYGGLLAAAAFAAWYLRRRKLSFPRIADLLAPQVALGHFFGRLGCYLAGCCWGTACTLPWAARFPKESLVFQKLVAEGALSPGASFTAPLHPVQLYEAFGNLLLYVGLSLLAVRKRFHGQVLVAYLLAYALLRLTTELLRGDALRRFALPHLSTSQAVALLTVPLALAALRRWGRSSELRFSTKMTGDSDGSRRGFLGKRR